MLDESAFVGTRLCVVGNICRDVKTAALPPGEHLFRDGETPTEFIVDTIGGGGANSALMARRLGAEVRFVGKIGDDDLGSRLEAALAGQGVRTFLRRAPSVATGSSVALSFDNGCRHFVSCQPNNAAFGPDDVDPKAMDGAGHLLRADVWFSQPMLDEGNAALFQAARDRGMTTSLDLNWDPCWGFAGHDLVQRRKQAVRRVLPLVDLVHGNIRELNLFADSDRLPATLERLAAWGVGAVVIHMGADGAGYFRDGTLTTEPCVPVAERKNAAGSGDLLSVCMMLLDRHHDVPAGEKLRLANRIVAEFIEGRREFLPPLAG